MRVFRVGPAWVVVWTLSAIVASAAWAQVDPRIDAETGRDLANYPPPLHFDHLHMRLELDIPTMSQPRLAGRQRITAIAIGSPRQTMILNAQGMTIRSVLAEDRPVSFTHDGQRLDIHFPEPIAPGHQVEVTIAYDLDFASHRGIGLTWSSGRDVAANETDAAPQIHAQGQPENNRMWFPCHDFPNDRLTTEIILTVEDGFEACSNGRLVSREPVGEGRTRWHWRQDQSHPVYLVTLVVGKFEVIDLGGPESARPGLPMKVYAPHGSGRRVERSFGRTPDMIAHFEALFDEPLPWDKYDQLLVRNFRAGAMENTSATTFQAAFAMMGRDGVEPIVAHELVHHWFGNLVGYKSWEHLWIGEGWASMGEALWAEASATPDQAAREYQRVIARFFGQQRGRNRTTAPLAPAMVSRYYAHPDQNFFKSNDVYSKGAFVLHLLRMRLGDETFFKGVRLFIDRFKFTQVETDDFRMCLEEVSGESLERFFDQWCHRPGLPRLDVQVRWDAESSCLRVRAEQTQTINADNPAYAMEVPIYVTFAEGEGRYVYLRTDQRVAEQTWAFDEPPADVVVDPYFASGAPCRVDKSLAMWLEQIEHGPTYFAQVQAAEHLAWFDDLAAIDALTRVAEMDAVGEWFVPDGTASRARVWTDDPLRWAAEWSLAEIESRAARRAEVMAK